MRWVKGGAAEDGVDLSSAYRMPPPGEVFVRANFATSIDGAVETNGTSRGVSSDIDRKVFHVIRSLCDVVLVGAQTVRAEGYGPMRADPQTRSARAAGGFAEVAPIAVVTRSGDLDPTSRLFTEPVEPTIVLAPLSSATALTPLNSLADIMWCGEDSVDIDEMLAALASRGLSRVLCEGGPSLMHLISAAGRLDELCLTISPVTAGPGSARLARAPVKPALELQLAHAIEAEGSVFLRYQVQR